MTVMTDIEGHWSRDSVYRLIDRGIVNEIKLPSGDYRFKPERTVTRAEFAKMLALCEGNPKTGANIMRVCIQGYCSESMTANS